MATIKLITGTVNSKKQSVIYLQYIHNGKRLLFSTSVKLDKDQYWDSKLRRVKKLHPEHIQLNELLNQKVSSINQLVIQCQSQNVDPSIERIRNLVYSSEKIEDDFFTCFSSFLKEYTLSKSINTISIYNNVFTYLNSFENDTLEKIEWFNINHSFFERFTAHLLRNNLSTGTIKRNVSYLKSFLNHAYRKGLLKSKGYESFSIRVPKRDVLSLTEEELERVRTINLSDRLSKIRDAFYFSCITGGIRFSDIRSVKREAIEITKNGTILKLHAHKTKTLTIIPVLPYALALLKRRDYRLISVSHQRYLTLIKRICKQASITQLVSLIIYKGSERIEKVVPKYKAVGSHTARRTYITLSLDKNIPIQLIASITHNNNVSGLMKYVSIDEGRKVELVNKAWG